MLVDGQSGKLIYFSQTLNSKDVFFLQLFVPATDAATELDDQGILKDCATDVGYPEVVLLRTGDGDYIPHAVKIIDLDMDLNISVIVLRRMDFDTSNAIISVARACIQILNDKVSELTLLKQSLKNLRKIKLVKTQFPNLFSLGESVMSQPEQKYDTILMKVNHIYKLIKHCFLIFVLKSQQNDTYFPREMIEFIKKYFNKSMSFLSKKVPQKILNIFWKNKHLETVFISNTSTNRSITAGKTNDQLFKEFLKVKRSISKHISNERTSFSIDSERFKSFYIVTNIDPSGNISNMVLNNVKFIEQKTRRVISHVKRIEVICIFSKSSDYIDHISLNLFIMSLYTSCLYKLLE